MINRFSLRVLSILLIMFCMQDVCSQVYKYSNEFLSIGVGARSFAMSNSTICSVDDVTSGYWNPAGLLKIKNNLNLGLMHSEYFAGLAKFDYGAVAIKNSDSSAFGLSLIRLGVDDIPNTLDLIDNNGNIRYDRITSFSVADYAFLLSYARLSKINGLRLGGNVKIIRRIVGEFASSWGFGLDAGAQYDRNKWIFGLVLRDATSTFNAWKYNVSTFEEAFNKTGNEIPENGIEITMPRLIAGAAYTADINNKFQCLIETNIDFTFDRKREVLIKSNLASIDPHIGIELNYVKLVYFRAGLGNFQKIHDFNNKEVMTFQPNIGIGIRYKRFVLDYSLTDISDQSIALYSNVISVYYSFDKK